MTEIVLPPLPAPEPMNEYAFFTAAQLQAYAHAAILADRESRAAGDGREDTARLDWLEQRGGWQFYRTQYDDPARKWFDSETTGSDYSPTLRDAIDAAMGDDDAR